MAQEKSPAYQWYPRDFQADEHVRLMTFEQRGIYRELLDHAWLHGSIPSDLTILSRLLGNGITPRRLGRLWPAIKPCWSGMEPGRLVNARQERDRAELNAFRVERSETGKRGADARWAKDGHRLTDGSANGSAIKQPMPNDGPAPATASAPATTTALPDDAQPTEAERIVRDSLQTPEYVQAFERLLRAAQKPGSLAASIRGFGPGGIHACATWPELGHALMDLAGAPGLATPAALKAFIRRIQGGDPPPRRAAGRMASQAENEATLIAWGAKGDSDGN